MADIKKELNDIKNAVYGREVRGSIHDGIKKINEEVENTTDRQDSVEAQFQSVLDETTGKDVISAPEITAARVGADNTNYPNLKERLDTEHNRLSSQLASIEERKANKESVEQLSSQLTQTEQELTEKIYLESSTKANKAYVDNKVAEVDSRIDDIITTPAEGITEQEIIDAREQKNTLGANIRDIREKASAGIVNKVIDGNFTKGLEEHIITRDRVEFVDGNVILIGESSDTSSGVISQRLATEIPVDENWYFISKMRALDPYEWIGVGARGSSGADISRVYNPVVNQWYTLSHYMSGEDYSGLSGTFNATTWGGVPNAIGKRVEVEYYMAFNLTEAFGRGNEPTKEEMDNLLLDIGYFEGDLGSGRLANKLLKKQKSLENEILKLGYSDLENVLEYGREHWISQAGTSTIYDDETDKITIRGSGASSIVASRQPLKNYDKGHKFYVSGDITPNADMQSFGFALTTGLPGEENIFYLTTSDVDIGVKTNISGILEVPAETNDLRLQLRGRFDTSAETDGATIDFENLFLYDLTSFFGKGNEPTAEGFELMLKNIDIKKGKTEVVETQKALTQLIFKELRSKSSANRLERPLAVVSFDDQHLSDYEKAFPFLRARGIRGTCYVITSRVGATGKMDWHHLRELKDAGWGIECHSHSHPNLAETSDEDIRQEMETVNELFLQNGLAKPRHHALPYGAGWNSERVRNVVGEYRKTIRNTRALLAGNNPYENINFLALNGLSIDMNEHRQDRLDDIKALMKHSAENNEIVLLYAHKLVDSPPTNDNTPETIFDMWAELIDYAIDLDFEFVTQDEMYLRAR